MLKKKRMTYQGRFIPGMKKENMLREKKILRIMGIDVLFRRTMTLTLPPGFF